MDQDKIGRFLSELRKEQGMTQQQLADTLGVSNKTISKWECGKGMPEISSIMPLCQKLHITVNELISGERLPEDGYSKKAEENMIHLIHEAANSKKESRTSRFIIFVTIITVLLGVCAAVLINGGVSMITMLVDMPTLLPMLLVTILFLLGTHLGNSFLQAFTIAIGKREVTSTTELIRAQSALKLVSHTFLGMGIFESCVGFMAITLADTSAPFFSESIYYSIQIALLGTFYGLIGFLLLLPIRAKIESMRSIENCKNR